MNSLSKTLVFEAPGASKVSRNRSGEAQRGFVQPAKVALISPVAPKLRFRALKWLRSVGNQRASAELSGPQPPLKSGQAANAIKASSNVIRSPLSIPIYLSIYQSISLSLSLYIYTYTQGQHLRVAAPKTSGSSGGQRNLRYGRAKRTWRPN